MQAGSKEASLRMVCRIKMSKTFGTVEARKYKSITAGQLEGHGPFLSTHPRFLNFTWRDKVYS